MLPTTIREITDDTMREVWERTYKETLPLMPIDMLLTYVPAERIVSYMDEHNIWQQPAIQKIIFERIEKIAEQKEMQRILLRLLRRKFGEVPNDIVKLIEQTYDNDLLDSWSDRIFDVDTLGDMQFNSI